MEIQEILYYAAIVFLALAALFAALAVYWFMSRNVRDVIDDLNGKKIAASVERESRNIGRTQIDDRAANNAIKAAVRAGAPEDRWSTGGDLYGQGNGARGASVGARRSIAAGSGSADAKVAVVAADAKVAVVAASAGVATGAASASSSAGAQRVKADRNEGILETSIGGGMAAAQQGGAAATTVDFNERPATEIVGFNVEDAPAPSAASAASAAGLQLSFKVVKKIVLTDTKSFIRAS